MMMRVSTRGSAACCRSVLPLRCSIASSHRGCAISTLLGASAVHGLGARPRLSPVQLRPRCPPAAAAAGATAEGATELQGDPLQLFLGWAMANGVTGLGTAESKLSMYEGENGERGFLAVQDIKEGDVLLRVPLRLALADFADDEESNNLLYKGAPWGVRLSAKLLREVAQGSSNPRWPYLQVLPALVPAPLETLTWDQMQDIQYAPGKAALDRYNFLVVDSYASCSPEAVGGATEEQFKWAMSIVHSRTFANAAPGGGVGVRMLVPLVDMFNHGGDVTASGLLSDPERVPTDNVRWDIVQAAGEGEWEMVVKATQDVEPGYQLLVCYGERSNDDFFLHYGFVPESNPLESACLFDDLEAALNWHYETECKLEETVALPKYQRALEVSEALQSAAQAGLKRPPGDEKKVLLSAGGRVDGALMTAFAVVASTEDWSDERIKSFSPEDSGPEAMVAASAVSRRCKELLASYPTTLLQDASILWADATAKGDDEGAYGHMQVMNHYRQAMLRHPESAGSLGSTKDLPIEAFAFKTYGSLPPRPAAEGDAPTSSSATGPQFSPSDLLVVRYRLQKKMVLLDTVLAVESI